MSLGFEKAPGILFAGAFLACGMCAGGAWAQTAPIARVADATPAAPSQPTDDAILTDPSMRQITGDVKLVSGRSVIVSRGSGFDAAIMIPASATLVAVEPGQRDLKGAAPMAVAELRPGDSLDARGVLSDDNSALVASVVLVTRAAMKRSVPSPAASAAAARGVLPVAGPDRAQVMLDWQKRGVGGIVTDIDRDRALIKISLVAASGKRTITVHSNRDTVTRHYALDSVKLEDDVPATFAEIRAGDELQARGAHSRDGKDLTADEIVFGSFRNISGTVDSVDRVNGMLTVTDRATQQPVTIQVTGRSQIRKLPLPAAHDIAARLKSAILPASGSMPKGNAAALIANANAALGDAQADFEQAVSRIPDAKLGDLEPGGAVMVVAAPNSDGSGVTAVILVGGVESIVTGSLDGANSLSLAPWILGPAAGDAPVANP